MLFFTAGDEGGSIVPLEEMPGLEDSEFGLAICRARGYENTSFLLAHFAAPAGTLLFPPHRSPDVEPPPVPMFRLGAPPTPAEVFTERAGAYLRSARYDVQIAGPKTVRLFHAARDKLFISVELDYLNAWYKDKVGNPIKNPPPAPDRQLRTGKLPVDFTEHFAAYTVGGRDYLVTDNGKVYSAVAKGKGEVEVSALWNDPKRKIVGVIQD
ncbi:MAG: hypothetical protein J0I06_12745, partial [Planctomycetes bacterium]|nr:hypothetical protein [Planctomycetota bacterium]